MLRPGQEPGLTDWQLDTVIPWLFGLIANGLFFSAPQDKHGPKFQCHQSARFTRNLPHNLQ